MPDQAGSRAALEARVAALADQVERLALAVQGLTLTCEVLRSVAEEFRQRGQDDMRIALGLPARRGHGKPTRPSHLRLATPPR